MSRDREYDNTNTGALFENNRRNGNSRAPEWRGSITVKTPDGEIVEYWVSCWEKTSRNGDPFMSLALDLKEDRDGRNDDRRGGGRDRDDDGRSTARHRDSRDSREDDRRGTRFSRSRDDDRGDPRDRDDRRGRDDGPRERERKSVDKDLDDEIPFN